MNSFSSNAIRRIGAALLSTVLIGCAGNGGRPYWATLGGCQTYSDLSNGWMGCDFTTITISDLEIAPGTWLVHSNFLRANFSGATMSEVLLYFNDFKLANLSGANLQGSVINHTEFQGVNAKGADLRDSWFRFVYAGSVDFTNANLDGVRFEQIGLNGASFVGASLRDASFFGADIGGADFTDADLQGATFFQMTSRGGFYGRPTIYCRTTMPDGIINNEGC